MIFGTLRPKPDRLTVLGLRLFELIGSLKRIGQVRVGLRVPGIQANRLTVLPQESRYVPGRLQSFSEIRAVGRLLGRQVYGPL